MIDIYRLDNPDKLGMSPENVINFYKLTKHMESEEQYDIFHTWNIKKGSHNTSNMEYEIDEEVVEITDSEDYDGDRDEFGNTEEKII